MKTKGYIVLDKDLFPLLEIAAEGRTLWIDGRHATLYPTYEAARNACRRTLRYAIRKGYLWGRDNSIMRVTG